jgi:hypothetical protein
MRGREPHFLVNRKPLARSNPRAIRATVPARPASRNGHRCARWSPRPKATAHRHAAREAAWRRACPPRRRLGKERKRACCGPGSARLVGESSGRRHGNHLPTPNHGATRWRLPPAVGPVVGRGKRRRRRRDGAVRAGRGDQEAGAAVVCEEEPAPKAEPGAAAVEDDAVLAAGPDDAPRPAAAPSPGGVSQRKASSALGAGMARSCQRDRVSRSLQAASCARRPRGRRRGARAPRQPGLCGPEAPLFRVS